MPKKILVVDDNADAAISQAMLLKLHGHSINVAHDGETALRLYREFGPDIIILDIGMPRISGLDICKKIREDDADTFIIAVTGYGTESDKAKSRAVGFDSHLTKPVDFAELEEILRGVGR